MNRIILIGNGFDLAHRIKTGYKDFINEYWKNVIKELKRKGSYKPFENSEIKYSRIPKGIDKVNTLEDLLELNKISAVDNTGITFKNRFLQIITRKVKLQNWVDIENEYYNLLIESYKISGNNYTIIKLNTDFLNIKNLLIQYLIKVENRFKKKRTNTKQIRDIHSKIYSDFRLKDFTEESIISKVNYEFNKIKKYLENLEDDENDYFTLNDVDAENQEIVSLLLNKGNNKEERLKIIKDILINDKLANKYFDLEPTNILLLNFNYTNTETIYLDANKYETQKNKKIKTYVNHIHGSNSDLINNPIIFGFGDELDNEYKEIEKLNDNNYLKNIKSINYLQTDKYKKLLEFINSGGYQIYIFGHSCGLSDRTLLNTLFEHKNCVSIKPFYHKINKYSDNYNDIVMNISRNFNDKVSMRNKVVNKTYCKSLT